MGQRATVPVARKIATQGLAILGVHEWAEAAHNSADGLADATLNNVGEGQAASAIEPDACA